MLFTDSALPIERLTDATIVKLRSADSVERYQDCGWYCATGYKDGRVAVIVHADSKAELDLALCIAPEAAAIRRRRKHRTFH
jgi:hypothetical protein